jgi:hypothetical protein
MKSAQTPIVIPLDLIPDLELVLRDAMQTYSGSRETPDYAVNVALFFSNIGDACRHSAHIPSVTITLTPDQQSFLLSLLSNSVFDYNHVAKQIHSKIVFLQPNIGDACRHSAHIPEAPGQGGTND